MNQNMTLPIIQDDEEDYSRLSFCDLPISGAATPHRPTTPSDHLFEFSATAAANSYYNDIIFCGKIIHGDDEDDQDQLSEFEKRDYFASVKSQSLRKPSFHAATAENRRLSASTRFSGDIARPKYSAGNPVYLAQRVNISSLTSMSAKSRRRMFMFGPVKFKPEMELSSIKQRQAKLAAAPEKVPPPIGGGKSNWGVVKSSFRGRSHLVRALAKSLGCIPAAGGGGFERLVGVAN